jgi:hypothetical protein
MAHFTLGELIDRAEHEGMYVEDVENHLIGPGGRQENLRVLVRELPNGNKAKAVLPKIKDDDGLTPSTLRTILRRLGVLPSMFALNNADLDIRDDDLN